jgi:hypothetical protein
MERPDRSNRPYGAEVSGTLGDDVCLDILYIERTVRGYRDGEARYHYHTPPPNLSMSGFPGHDFFKWRVDMGGEYTKHYFLAVAPIFLLATAALVISIVEIALSAFGIAPHLSVSIQLSGMTALLAAYIGYVVVMYYRTESKLNDVLSLAKKKDVWTFVSRDKWLKAMTDCAIRADAVCTQHYSDPPGTWGKSTTYFEQIHEHIKRNPRQNYKRICTVGDREKAHWIFGTIFDLAGNDNFSVAVTPLDRQSLALVPIDHNSCTLNCYEICRRGGEFQVFVFSTPPRTGEVKAFLIHDNLAGQAAQDAFESSWSRAMKIKEGHVIEWHNIQRLARQFDLENDAVYLKLLSRKSLTLDDAESSYGIVGGPNSTSIIR